MPDLQEEPGKIKYFDAAQHSSDTAHRAGLRFTRGGVLRAAATSLALLALLALLSTSTRAARRATAEPPRRAAAGAPCAEPLRDEPAPRVETERARYGLTATTATNAAAFEELVAAANQLLDVRRQRSALLARLDQPGPGPALFDATAAEIARLDDDYRHQVAAAVVRYPALGAVLQEPGQEDPDLRLLAVAGGPLNSTVDVRQLRPQGQQLGAGAVAHALDAHPQARDADPRAALESRCALSAAGATVADTAGNLR